MPNSPSQVVLEYLASPQPLEETSYHDDCYLWGNLPLHSAQKLVVIVPKWDKGVDDVWFVDLLRDLGSLKDLESRGHYGCTCVEW